MEYKNIKKGIFCSRPNRFIAMVEIDGVEQTCHVKNTGRCKELLIPGVPVYLEEVDSTNRKTKYDVIGVEKKNLYINMDSQAPNKVAREWLEQQDWDFIKAECKYGNSRLDFYMEKNHQGEKLQAFMEVKGVTLEENNIARFPDAPTERGVRHIQELIELQKQGYQAMILFVIQMKGVTCFQPNDKTHPEFGNVLREAHEAGVKIFAYDCIATPNFLVLDEPVEIKL